MAFSPSRLRLSSALCRHRGRRQYRPDHLRGQCGPAASSGVADQDHDALHAVRATRSRQAQARHAVAGLGPCGRHGSGQARSQGRPDHPARGCPEGDGHQIGERRRGGGGRSDRRRRRGGRRQADDGQGESAGNDGHDLCQRLRLAGRRADHHRPRPGAARPDHPQSLSQVLHLLFDAELQLSRPGDAQSQRPVGQCEGRRRDQDGLHRSLRIQSRGIGQPRRPAHRRGRAGRHLERPARQPHAQADRRAYCPRFGAAHRPGDHRSGERERRTRAQSDRCGTGHGQCGSRADRSSRPGFRSRACPLPAWPPFPPRPRFPLPPLRPSRPAGVSSPPIRWCRPLLPLPLWPRCPEGVSTPPMAGTKADRKHGHKPKGAASNRSCRTQGCRRGFRRSRKPRPQSPWPPRRMWRIRCRVRYRPPAVSRAKSRPGPACRNTAFR